MVSLHSNGNPKTSIFQFSSYTTRLKLALESLKKIFKPISFKILLGVGEMAQWLRALTALLEVMHSNLSNLMVDHNHL